jgi:hypothetical protein
LAQHVRQHAVQAGYPSLAKAVKATVQRILAGIAEINVAPVVHRWKKFEALSPAGAHDTRVTDH